MIDNGMQASMRMDLDLIAAPVVAREKPFFTVDGVVRLLLIGSAGVLLLPALLIVSMVAILVPCFFRVPVCGTSGK